MTDERNSEATTTPSEPEPATGNPASGAAAAGQIEPTPSPPTKNKGGAPKGNKNALKHGRHARFTLGLMPKRLKGIERSVGEFRRIVERAVIDARGTVSVLDAARVTSAAKWERHSQLMHHWLRTKHAELSHENLLKYSREAARASSERDRCLTALRLDAANDDAWASLYEQPQLAIIATARLAAPPPSDAIDVEATPTPQGIINLVDASRNRNADNG